MKDLLITTLSTILFLQNIGWRPELSYGMKFVLTVTLFFTTLSIITEIDFYITKKLREKKYSNKVTNVLNRGLR